MDREKIKARRIKAKMTQKALSEASEVSRVTIIKAESGEGIVLDSILRRLDRALSAVEGGSR